MRRSRRGGFPSLPFRQPDRLQRPKLPIFEAFASRGPGKIINTGKPYRSVELCLLLVCSCKKIECVVTADLALHGDMKRRLTSNALISLVNYPAVSLLNLIQYFRYLVMGMPHFHYLDMGMPG